MRKSALKSGKVARCRHQFAAAPEIVFDAWFDPDMLAAWMFDPSYRCQKTILLQTNPVVGGGFRFEVERDGRSVTYTGEYLAIERPSFLKMTWKIEGYQHDTLVTVDIQPRAGGCVLHLEHELGEVPDHFVDEVEGDWSADFRVLASKVH